MVEYTKLLVKNVFYLIGKQFLNKTGRGVGITRLNEALVPIAKAMETTCHPTMDAFKKYNHEKQILSERATQCIMSGEMQDGTLVSYEDVYKEELEKYKFKVLYLLLMICGFSLDIKLWMLLTNMFFVHQQSRSYVDAASLTQKSTGR